MTFQYEPYFYIACKVRYNVDISLDCTNAKYRPAWSLLSRNGYSRNTKALYAESPENKKKTSTSLIIFSVTADYTSNFISETFLIYLQLDEKLCPSPSPTVQS